MHVDHDRWQKINQAYFLAMDVKPELREMLLSRLYGDDPSLLEEVASLISADQSAGEFLRKTARDLYKRFKETHACESMEGRKFGAYRVLRKIEHGGMGEIYLAERDDNHYRKRVAVKIIRRGLDSESILQNFCNERQILADLDHPYIARLLDGGTTEDGLPYLVMEYVAGERIDNYCDVHHLSLVERLHLFLKVCSAVHRAHQGQVIHRDLKPSNILITPEGNPKLLDFGVAKLMDQKFSVPSPSNTLVEPLFITPEYASPEQIYGHTISVATDIYSLGILLYVLLSGRHPYQTGKLLPHELLRTLCQSEPEKPSASIDRIEPMPAHDGSPSPLSPMEISSLRGERPEQLRRNLAGDLDSIILMAIRKEPECRYSSVEQFTQDIQRYLEKKPVFARKNTLAYRVCKFGDRNKLRIMGAVLALAGLFMVGWTVRWQTNQEKRQLRGTLLHRLNSILEAHDEERGVVVNTSHVIFDPGHINLNSDARERLAKIAGIVLAYPKLKLQVEGHTDNNGDQSYNLAISQERAQAVRAYLVMQGISPEMITAKGVGGTQPIASNESETGRQRNRRVEIILSGYVIGRRISADSHGTPTNSKSISAPLPISQAVRNSVLMSNLALNKKVTSSIPCNANEGPEKAVNGSAIGGNRDKWCSHADPAFLQVDLGKNFMVDRFIIRHAGAGGEPPVLNTRDFNIRISTDGWAFVTVVNVTHNTRSITVHTIPAAIARLVQLNVTTPAQHGDNSSRIYEFEVYGQSIK
jgi:serine/threonine protein kinase